MGSPSATDMKEYAATAPPVAAAPVEEYKTIDLLIEQLKAIRETKGNLTAVVQTFDDSTNSYSFKPVAGFFFMVNETNEAQQVILCDKDTLDGLSENSEVADEDIKPKGVN